MPLGFDDKVTENISLGAVAYKPVPILVDEVFGTALPGAKWAVTLRAAGHDRLSERIECDAWTLGYCERLTGNDSMTRQHSEILALALTLLVAMPACSAVTPATVDAATLKKRIQQGHVLDSGLDVSIRIDGPEVVVSTMLSKQQKEPTTDCKIDAAMIAKTVFETPKSQFARVKVRFYDPKNLSRYHLVRVTAGDVAAFSSRRLSTQQFLESLEVIEQTDAKPQASTTALAAAADAARSVKPPALSTATPVPSPTSTPADSFVPYESTAGAMIFKYPSTFSAVERPDKDTLAKFEGATIDGTHYEMTLSMAPAHFMAPERFAQFTDQLIFQSLDGYRRVRSENVLIGPAHKIPAHINEIEFGAAEAPSRLTVVHFRAGQIMYTLGFIAKSSEQTAMVPLINRTLLSVQPSGKMPELVPSEVISFTDSRYGISFDYPKVWRDASPSRPEFIKCLEGPIGPFTAELKLGSADVPGVTSNKSIAELVENRALKPMQNYVRLRGTDVVFGRSANIQGYRLASRFRVNKMNVIEHLVIFSHRGKHYVLSFLLFEGGPLPAQNLFDRILSTISLR